MKYYNTKYALSTGVTYTECTPSSVDSNRVYPEKTFNYGLTIGKDAFINKEDAEKSVELARLKKIESLKKQIKKLETKTVVWHL